jgi:hypothetical protein
MSPFPVSTLPLSESYLTHIFETSREGWDYQPRLKAVLKHYKAWAGKP